MTYQHASSTPKSPSSTSTQNPSAHSQNKTQRSTQGTSRNAKRARWAKKNKPVAKSVAKPLAKPEREYISACCSALATKPRAGQRETAADPESGKMKTAPKGLGHWRCTQCRKSAKVTPRKPEEKPKEVPSGNVVQN